MSRDTARRPSIAPCPWHYGDRLHRLLRLRRVPIRSVIRGLFSLFWTATAWAVMWKKALDLRGIVEGPYGWTRSYTNLAGKYGFYYHVFNGSMNEPVHGGSRTVPGQFGARAAKLLRYLSPEHYGVNLPRKTSPE